MAPLAAASAADRAAVGQRRDRARIRHARAAAPPKRGSAVPPLIAPLLVSVVIVPAFDTPAPPAPPEVAPPPPLPPLIVAAVGQAS